MPTIGPLHHQKPGTEAGRLACLEQRSICLSVSTTRASFAGEVQWNVSAFGDRRLCILRFESCALSQQVAGSLALSWPSANRPDEGWKSATIWLFCCGRRVWRRRLSARVCDFSFIISRGQFRGHSSRSRSSEHGNDRIFGRRRAKGSV